MKVNPYLFFKGNCAEAFKLYADVLGGKIVAMMPHKGSPAEAQTPKEWQDKIMHARLDIGDQMIMASDAPPGHQANMGGFSISLDVATPAEAERVFAGLSKGGTVGMPLGETFFAKSFGMLTDRFGTPWMIICPKPM
jgi:PhnB protein